MLSTISEMFPTSLSSFLPSPTIIHIYLLIELSFQIATLIICKTHMQPLSIAPPHIMEPHLYVLKCLERLSRVTSNDKVKLEKFLSGWCRNSPFSSICRGNLLEFMTFAHYNKQVVDATSEELSHVNDFLSFLATEHAIVPKAGYNPAVKAARLSLESITFIPRPIIFYVIVHLMNSIKHVLLSVLGFRHLKCAATNTKYYHRYGTTAPRNNLPQPPMIFFPGISPAQTLFYLPLLFMGLLKKSSRELVILENKSVGMTLSLHAQTEESLVKTVGYIIERHFLEDITLLSHSLGSCPTTWVLRAFPDKIKAALLLDPVTAYLSSPAVATAFVYPSKFTKLTEWIIFLAASTEPYIAWYLKRHFWWYRNELWVEDISKDIEISIILSQDDEIVPSTEIYEGINRQREWENLEHVTLQNVPGHHGFCIYAFWTWERLAESLALMEKKGEMKRKSKGN